MTNTNPEPKPAQRLLHLVFGGELTSVAGGQLHRLFDPAGGAARA